MRVFLFVSIFAVSFLSFCAYSEPNVTVSFEDLGQTYSVGAEKNCRERENTIQISERPTEKVSFKFWKCPGKVPVDYGFQVEPDEIAIVGTSIVSLPEPILQTITYSNPLLWISRVSLEDARAHLSRRVPDKALLSNRTCEIIQTSEGVWEIRNNLYKERERLRPPDPDVDGDFQRYLADSRQNLAIVRLNNKCGKSVRFIYIFREGMLFRIPKPDYAFGVDYSTLVYVRQP
jgi:hypothetical protein